MANSEEEIWKPHPEYAGIEVSTFGNVRTLDKVVSNGRGTYHIKGRILKPVSNSRGYMQVSVKVDGKWTNKSIHRLVAQTFIQNPDNLPQVNHRDCDRTNNNVENLEFCTASYNQKYREKFGISQTEAVGHRLFAINLATLEVLHFRAQSEASRELGVYRQNIDKVIKGKLKQSGGFWFVNDDGHAVDVVKSKLHDVGKTGLKI